MTRLRPFQRVPAASTANMDTIPGLKDMKSELPSQVGQKAPHKAQKGTRNPRALRGQRDGRRPSRSGSSKLYTKLTMVSQTTRPEHPARAWRSGGGTGTRSRRSRTPPPAGAYCTEQRAATLLRRRRWGEDGEEGREQVRAPTKRHRHLYVLFCDMAPPLSTTLPLRFVLTILHFMAAILVFWHKVGPARWTSMFKSSLSLYAPGGQHRRVFLLHADHKSTL